MKPHEETWDNGREFEVTVCGPELDRDIDAPREVLARAAPEMARALIPFAQRRCEWAHLFDGNSCDEECKDTPADWCITCIARAALAKAGVVP